MTKFVPVALLSLLASCGAEPPPSGREAEEAASLEQAVRVTSEQADQIAEILTRDGQKCDKVETLAPQPPVWRIVCANKAERATAFTYDPARKLLLADEISPAEALRPTRALPD